MATAEDFVKYFVNKKIRTRDYEAATGDDVSEDDYTIGEDMFYAALVNCGGDFTEAAREYDSNYSTMWTNFKTALFAVSDTSSYSAIESSFVSAWETDYPEDNYPNASKLKETYAVIFQALTNCWLYQIHARTESEKMAEDKKEMCQKLLYDVVGKAALSPTISDSLDHGSSGASNYSAAAKVENGNMSTDLLDGFTDGYDGF